jgi:hypothetical protein
MKVIRITRFTKTISNIISIVDLIVVQVGMISKHMKYWTSKGYDEVE